MIKEQLTNIYDAEFQAAFPSVGSDEAHKRACLAVAEWSRQRALREMANMCSDEICACCWDDDAQAAAEHLADKFLALAAQPGTAAQGKGET